MSIYSNGSKVGSLYKNGKRVDMVYKGGKLIYVSSRNNNTVSKQIGFNVSLSSGSHPQLDKSGNYLSVTGDSYIYILDISNNLAKYQTIYNYGSRSATDTLIDSDNNLVITDNFSILKKQIPSGNTISSNTYLYSSDNQNTIIRGQTSIGDYVITNLTTSEIYILDKDKLSLKSRKTFSEGSTMYDCKCSNGVIAMLQGGLLYIINENNLSVITSISVGGTNSALKLIYVKNIFFVIGQSNFSRYSFFKDQGTLYHENEISYNGTVSYEFGGSDGYYAYYATSDNVCHKMDKNGKEISTFLIDKNAYWRDCLYVDRKNAITAVPTSTANLSKVIGVYQY